MRNSTIAATLTLILAALTASVRGAVVLSPPPSQSYFSSYAYDGSGVSSNPVFVPAVPFTSSTAISRSGSTANTTASLTAAGFSAIFDQTRSGAQFGEAASVMDVMFSVTGSSTFSVTGNYSVQDTNGVHGRAVFDVRLFDATVLTNELTLFQFDNESRVTANPSFTVGHATGDYAPGTAAVGAQTGALLPGHRYDFNIQVWTDSPLAADQGGRGIGGATLDVTPVPEPTGAIALLPAAFGILRRRRT